MPHLLTLRGRHALSPFRIKKLHAAFAAAHPGHLVTRIASTFWHFVEVERELTVDESAIFERLLTYGPQDEAATDDGALMLVVPRPGTISPWSSKATDIARNCGLDVIRRIERGVAWNVRTRGETLSADDRGALLPLMHDRMTEVVADDPSAADAPVMHYPPRPVTT